MELVDQLRNVTASLLDVTRPAYSLRAEVLELKAIFEQASGRTFSQDDGDIAFGETLTEGGVAISPAMAAMCLDDFARTVQFLRGLHDAIADAKLRTNRSVRILYAGCGPWATLAIPLMSIFGVGEVEFILIDLHRASIDSVRKLTRGLGVSDRVLDIKLADAGSYIIQDDEIPDLIVVEMLRAGLEAEPQVAVTKNLMGQAPNAVLIPAAVSLEVALVNPAREFSSDRDRIVIDTVLRLRGSGIEVESVRVPIPTFDKLRYRLMILTTILVYGDLVLRDYDSGITCPKLLRTSWEIEPDDVVEFTYVTGRRPSLKAARGTPRKE